MADFALSSALTTGASLHGHNTLQKVIGANLANDDGRPFLRLVHATSEDEALSYADLILEAGRWSELLKGRGLAAGDRAVIILQHGVDLYASYIGAIIAGVLPAMFAPPSAKFSRSQYWSTIGDLLERSDARLLVTFPELAEKLGALPEVASRKTCIVSASDLTTPRGTKLPDDAFYEPDPASPALLQYSSGTTGLKKGVTISHTALLWQIESYAEAIALNKNDIIASWLPLYHDMGLVACFMMPLAKAVPVIAMSPFEWVARPVMWAQTVSRHRATLSWLPNFAFPFMAHNIRDHEIGDSDLSSLRGIVNCSEPIIAESIDAFVERFSPYGLDPNTPASSYALAENTFAATSSRLGAYPQVDVIDGAKFDVEQIANSASPNQTSSRRMVSSGRPLPGTRIQITDENGVPCPDRRVGEILIESPCLMTGYDGNTNETSGVLQDGVFHSGDLGYLADGELYVTGRKKDLIIVGGKNLYPQDIEDAVGRIEKIIPGRLVAFGIPDITLGTERLIVVAETAETDPAELASLTETARRTVTTMCDVAPHDVQLVPPRWLEKSTSGKISRNRNRERYLSDIATASKKRIPAPADDDIHATVARCVGDVAGTRIVTDETELISSGIIDSFALTELIAAIETTCGVRIGARQLASPKAFESIPAIVDMVSSLRDATDPPTDISTDLRGKTIPMTGTDFQPSPVTRGFWTTYYKFLFRLYGISYGPGLRVRGRLLLDIDGDAQNIKIGRNVTLMPGVHLKVRENGKIILHDGVRIDTGVRLVAANDAEIEIGEQSAIGMGSIVNAGRDVRIGRNSLTAGYCLINVSDHAMVAGVPIREQEFLHAPILIGEDVWLGAHVFVSRGSRLGHGAVVSAGSVVSGDVPNNAVVQGRPARVIKFRSPKDPSP